MFYDLLSLEIGGNSLVQWLSAMSLAAGVFCLIALVRHTLLARLGPIAERTPNTFDDAVVGTVRCTKLWLMLFPALFIGVQLLELPERPALGKVLQGAAILALLVQVGFWSISLLDAWLNRSVRRAMKHDIGATTSLAAMGFVAKMLVWTFVLLVALDNLGVDITALVAGLGIGGIAVALAVQNVLGDLFASLSIVTDKPFVVGDFIVVDNYMGTVENVGIKTTRIRSLDGEQIVFSNGDLLKTRIRNYKRMRERRVLFGFGVSPDTGVEQLTRIPELVKEIVSGQKDTRLERAHFKGVGAAGFDFETVYWLTQPDYNLYMDVQQNINLELLRRLGKMKIEFAFQPGRMALDALRDEAESAIRTGGDKAPQPEARNH